MSRKKRAYRKREEVLKKSLEKSNGDNETRICARCYHEKSILDFTHKRKDKNRRKTCEECLDQLFEINLRHKAKMEKNKRERMTYIKNNDDFSNYHKYVKNNKTYIIL